MSKKIILVSSLLILTAAVVFSAMPKSLLAQEGVTSKTVILQDDFTANTLGWDPDDSRTTFLITDLSVSPMKSTVLINTVQFNFIVCSVDYITSNGFEVHCNEAPAEGGELHYTVFNNDEVESSGLPFLGQNLEDITVAEGATVGNRTLPTSNSTMNN